MKFLVPTFLFLLVPLNNLLSQTNQKEFDIESSNTEFRIVKSDSLLVKLNNDKNINLINGDTLDAIEDLIEISSIFSTNGNYSQSYDGYWEALIYSNAISDSTHIVKIYRKLGTLYSIFRREQKAEYYYGLSLKTLKKPEKTQKNA